VSAALVHGAWSAAFWAALLLARRQPGARDQGARVAAGLVLGALLGHLGWAALHASALWEAPSAWLDPTRGFCILFVPWGVLLSAPRDPAARRTYLDAALGALPFAFALARLGCFAAGCCGGVAADLPWAIGGRHPTALYEAAACAALHVALPALSHGRGAAALAGLGILRLAVEPLRAMPPLGRPALDASWLAALLVGLGAGLAFHERARWRQASPTDSVALGWPRLRSLRPPKGGAPSSSRDFASRGSGSPAGQPSAGR